MHERVARTLRYLASLINQQTARSNAAEGSDTLRRRREDQEHVEEYLQARLLTGLQPVSRTSRDRNMNRRSEFRPRPS